MNANMSELVTLFPMGAGTKRKTCRIISGKINVGDGLMWCDSEEKEYADKEYEIRGTVELARLDELIDEDIQVGRRA